MFIDVVLNLMTLTLVRVVEFWIFSVQHECIPQAVLSMDVLCQAKSGMGKTAVFVISTLQQIQESIDDVSVNQRVSCGF